MMEPKEIRVLIACEHSGAIRDAFRRLGFSAWSNDLPHMEPEGEFPQFHLRGDCRDFISRPPFGPWHAMIAHPECTYLTRAGLHWNRKFPEREQKTTESVEFVRWLLEREEIPCIAVENPPGRIGTAIRKADQAIQPFYFGDNAAKLTHLWLKGFPPLTIYAAHYCPGRRVEWPRGSGKIVERWPNQTDSGQNNVAPGPNRWKERSKTYPGIAYAIAWQWGLHLLKINNPERSKC